MNKQGADADTAAGCIVLAAMPWILLGAALIGVAANGFLLWVMWGWFVVPVLSLGAITFAQAAGLSLVSQALTRSTTLYKGHEIDLRPSLLGSAYRLLSLLAIGYALHFFV